MPPSTATPLPPESIFSTKEDLTQFLREWSAKYCFGFRIGRSRIKSKSNKFVYECDRAGAPPPVNRPQERIRSVSSRKTGCKFSIIVIESSTGSWEIRHRPDSQFAVHNHEPSLLAAAHY